MKYDLRVKAVLDALLVEANKRDIELNVEPAFGGTRKHMSCIIHNVSSHKFGLISTDVSEYPDDPVVLFSFNTDLYNYAKMEGFDTTEHILEGFSNKVFVKETSKAFFKYILA
jgi:hypothetical protein